MTTPKERLIALHDDFHGSTINKSDSELELIIDILELLIEKVTAQEDHSHRIS